MVVRYQFAGLLTSFGLLGLVMSPFVLAKPVNVPVPAAKIVSVAITSGPQLRLLRAGQASEQPAIGRPSAARAMICENVFYLSIADVGLSCTDTVAVRTVALADH